MSTTKHSVGSGTVTLNPFAAHVTEPTTDVNVLVVGDEIFDSWIRIRAVTKGPEEPGTIYQVGTFSDREILSTRMTAGGVLNLRENLKSVGIRTTVVSAQIEGQPACEKVRLVDLDGRILARYDIDPLVPPTEAEEQRICRQIEQEARQATHVLVCDYHKGTLSRAVQEALAELEIPLWIDPHRDAHYIDALQPQIVKANQCEYGAHKTHPGFRQATWVVTDGANGARIEDDDARIQYPAHHERPVICTVGAGSVFFAALFWCWTQKKSLTTATQIANNAAALSVQEAGPCRLTPEKLRDAEKLGTVS